MRFQFAALAALSTVLVSGCFDPPKKTEKKVEKLEPLTGRQAFQKMYPSARSWAADAVPLECKSLQLDKVKADKGKAGAWQCVFVSPGRGKQKPITYSTIEAEGNLHQGVFAGLEETYSESRQVKPWLIAGLKTDSDEAWTEAEKKSADYIKKNPNATVNYLLEQTPRFPDLTWRIVWGESVGTSDYSIFVDATTGQFLERSH